MTEVQGHRTSHQVLLAALWLTLLILALKVAIGWALQSLSLLAESLYTLIDSFSILLNLIALASPSDREISGHGKLEAILALLLVAFLGFACLSLSAVAMYELSTLALIPTANASSFTQLDLSMLQLLGVVMTTSFCLACFVRYLAGILKSGVLRLCARRLFQDVWLVLLVLVGLVVGARGQAWIDPLLAIFLIAGAIISCWRVLNRQLPSLLKQVAIAPEALVQTVYQVEGVTRCYGIHSRGLVGRQVHVEMHLVLHPEYVGMAKTITERVEQAIRERYGPVWVVLLVDRDLLQSHSKGGKVGRRD